MSETFDPTDPAGASGETGVSAPAQEEPTMMAQAVDLPEFSPEATTSSPRSMDLLLDVELPLTVELGHTRMAIKGILELGVGSVIKLDKAAGDPVDMLVNGRLVARGEVVVVDDSFGVRILGLVDPEQRLGGLK